MTKKKSIFLKVACFMLALGLAFIPLFSFKNKEVAKADIVTTNYFYQSSSFYVPFRRNADDWNGTNFCDFLIWKVSLTSGDNGVTIDITDTNAFIFNGNITWEGNTYNYTYQNNICFNNSLTEKTKTFPFNAQTNSALWYRVNNANTNCYGAIRVNSVGTFNCNVVSVEFGNYITDGKYWNYVLYTDDVGNTFKIGFYLSVIGQDIGTSNSNLLSYRVYYLNSEMTEDDLYKAGYSAGNTSGYETGYSDGSTAGYNNGYSAGEQAGINEGILQANDYSFLSLIGAVVDAPIKAFTGLFDFNLLGVNLNSFFFGLFSIAMTIAIIRIIKF